MSSQTFNVYGMHCASCAAIITKKISKLPNIRSVNVNYGNEKAIIDSDDNFDLQIINDEIGKLGYRLGEQGKVTDATHTNGSEKNLELIKLEQKTHLLIPIASTVFFLMMWDILAKKIYFLPNLPLPMPTFNTISMILATLALFWGGKQYVESVGRFFRYGLANMETLVGLGSLVAYFYSLVITLSPGIRYAFRLPEYTYFDVTIVVISFINLGKFLEAKAKLKTGDAIAKLLSLQTKTALVLRQGCEQEISISEVVRNDKIIIKPGAKIPVDGTIIEGSSFVDESMITGEPMPIKKNIGNSVSAGTINTNGSFVFQATRIGGETLLAQIIKMVEDAQNSKAPIQTLADKISGIFVPIVLTVSFASLAIWIIAGSASLGFSQSLSYGLSAFVGVLVIACPCALGLATPTAIIVGVGKGARAGILVKDAATLEKLYKADTVVLDKTGTLTFGKPEVSSLRILTNKSEEAVISILAGLENKSEHPLAHAVLQFAKTKNIPIAPVENFENLKGRGICGFVDNKKYFAGNARLVRDLGLDFDYSVLENETMAGKTPIVLTDESLVLAVLLVADTIKPEAKKTITDLRKLGIKTIMLTGDDKNTAEAIANEVGINKEDIVAEVLPEDKLKKIQELQKGGRKVVMVGDGINDAPALAQADVGIAMATGTDTAIAISGITLLGGDISKLTKTIRLSRLTLNGIKQNLFWAFAYNLVGIPLAAGVFFPLFGYTLSPVFAGLAMAFSSVSVVANSLRLKSKRL